MSRKNRNYTKKRLALYLIVVGLLFVICIGIAGYKMYRDGDEFRHRALAQAVSSSTTLRARPGNILDANGVALAVTEKVYRLILDPAVMAESDRLYPGTLDKTVEILAEALELSEEELREAFLSDTESRYIRFDTGELLSESRMERFEKLKEDFLKEKAEYNKKVDKENKIKAKVDGVWFEEEYRREYPQKTLLSKVIGFTTKDVTEGVMGLELTYGEEIRGQDGKIYSYISEDGTVTKEVEKAEDGLTVQTSLDVNVTKALKDAIASFREEIGGHRINVLVMNVKNGEILAMASDTDFDANDPTDLTSVFTEEELEDPSQTFLLQELYRTEEDKKKLSEMTREEQLEKLVQQVQMNYCVSGTYEPGSTSKTITLAAAIEENIVSPADTFYCDGLIQVGNYGIHCHQDTLCGHLTPMEALGRSCNVGYVQIGQKVGSSLLAKYQELMNLGQKTGIDLPGEANTSSLIYSEDTMHEVELATCSFGQGFNVTMIQFAAAYASMVNGGYYYKPHVVTGFLDSDGNVVSTVEPQLVRQTISGSTSDYLLKALNYVTAQGTAGDSVTEGYTIAGKTGAAEKLPRGTGKYVVSFISVEPADDPEYLLYAVVDEPYAEDQSMSKPAQILSKYCWQNLYSYFGIFPSDQPDAWEYDWASLSDFSDDGDSMKDGIITDISE